MADNMAGIGSLPMPGSLLREPYPSEADYFRANPHVAGMATEDNRVILNPYSSLSPEEMAAVYQNETARVLMRTGAIPPPSYGLTEEQRGQFGAYGALQDQRETIAARIASGDPSAGDVTPEQSEYATKLRRLLDGMVAPRTGGLSGLGEYEPWP